MKVTNRVQTPPVKQQAAQKVQEKAQLQPTLPKAQAKPTLPKTEAAPNPSHLGKNVDVKG